MATQAKNVFKKVLIDAIKNIFFYGVAAVVIAFIGNAIGLRIIGLILAGIFVVTMAISLIPFLISFFIGLIGIIISIAKATKGDKDMLKDEGYLWAGTLAQLIETVICLYYVLYLYRAFFD
jgi:hypothetical protein